jgi:hypothetical protein
MSDQENEYQWESTEGYTPLSEFQSSQTVMLSVGPDAGGGAFFADMSAFDYDNDNENTFTELVDDGDLVKEVTALDYRSVANQALSALDDEYRMTLLLDALDTNTATHMPPPVDNDMPLPPIRLAKEDFGPAFFKADFETIETLRQNPSKEIPTIDAEAVARAINAIRMKNPKLKENYKKWESTQKLTTTVAPRQHSLIPLGPLSAFRKQTPKALFATDNLTRSATIAEALVRLDLLQNQDYLQIDVVGCDHVECGSAESIRATFLPLVKWIGAHASCPKHLCLYLIGPNVPKHIPRRMQLTESVSGGALERVDIILDSVVYEERMRRYESKSPQPTPLIICFHPGIWGYAEWKPTLKYLARRRHQATNGGSTFFVATAYTQEECEDDADVIREVLAEVWECGAEKVEEACVWPVEMNAFASKQIRETASAPPGRIYRENAAWQAWRL